MRRRPLGWYEAILAKAGLVFLRTLPVFLFMCRPIFYGIHPNLGRVAYPGWVILRLATKYFARNGFWQTIFGHLPGACFYCLDRVALSMLKRTPNLEITIFRKS